MNEPSDKSVLQPTPRTDAAVQEDNGLLPLCRQLERELAEQTVIALRAVADLHGERAKRSSTKPSDAEIQLDAWHKVFETSQLSHAHERLRVAEEKVARLSATLVKDALPQWKAKPSAEEIEAHYPDSQHQPDECEMCRFIHDAAKAYVSAVPETKDIK